MPENTPVTAETKPDPDLSGRTLGDYQLLRRLGRGGMADVYLAEQKSLRRQVAFKVLKRSLANDETYVRRFHREAQAAAALVHANIVQIHEVGFLDGVHFIAQEYVAGQNLRQVLTRRRGPISAAFAVNVMRQVAAALYKAGEQGVIHRDIKPENILLSPTREVKVADFGLAQVTSDTKGLDLTQVGVTMGTPLYMSPEQIEGKTVDPSSDIYSFGITCYQMLAGRPPFEAETALGVAVQHLNKTPEPLAAVRPDLPEGLCHLVHRMLAKSPADRPHRAADLLRDLRALQVEGVDDDWPTVLDNRPGDDPVYSSSRIEATQRLAAVAKSDHGAGRTPIARWMIALAIVILAAAAGATAAWWKRPKPLLDPSTIGVSNEVEVLESAMDQYRLAIDRNTEPAWKKVFETFPPEKDPVNNERYALLAKLQLADFYRNQNRLEEGRRMYDEVIAYGAADKQYEAFALAGLANLAMRQGKAEDAQLRLADVAAAAAKLDMRYREQIRARLDEALRADFDTAVSSVPPAG